MISEKNRGSLSGGNQRWEVNRGSNVMSADIHPPRSHQHQQANWLSVIGKVVDSCNESSLMIVVGLGEVCDDGCTWGRWPVMVVLRLNSG